MSDIVRVDSVDALRSFRTALVKFAETMNVALGDVESELRRTSVWLETEQLTHWQSQVRMRTEAVAKAKDAVRAKKLYKDSTGRVQSAIDEEKALSVAQRRLAEAEQKLENTRKWGRRLQRELHVYKGGVGRFATALSADVPNAIAKLEKLAGSLDRYVAVSAASTAEAPADMPAAGAGAATDASMTRAEPGQVDTELPADVSDDPNFPALTAPQVAVGHRSGPAESPIAYTVFASIEAAKQHAKTGRIYGPNGRGIEPAAASVPQ